MGKTEIKNVIISPEYLDKIRRFAAIRPDETFFYVPIAYRELPDDLKPKFILRPITGEDALRYADAMRGEVIVDNNRAEVRVKQGEFIIASVKKGLVGFSNYYDLNGNCVEYHQGIIDNLPRALLEELSDIITERSKLTEEEVLGLK